jgi:hypothetical protein
MLTILRRAETTHIDVRARADRLHLHLCCRVALATHQSHPRLHLRRRIHGHRVDFLHGRAMGRACGPRSAREWDTTHAHSDSV